MKPRNARNSYTFDVFRESDREAHRLSCRTLARIDHLVPQLRELGLEPDMTILDVGCGGGERTVRIAQSLPQGRVIGIDSSRSLLRRARRLGHSLRTNNVSFYHRELDRAGFPKHSFDGAYLRLLVQHLPRPIESLKRVHALLKPGGFISIEDTDRDWMTIYPSPDSWTRFYPKVKAIQRRKGGDPNSGRKLAHYLTEAGFGDVRTRMIPVTGANAVIEDWLAHYAPTFFTNMSPSEERRGLQALEDIRRMNAVMPVYFYQVWFQATGRK